MDTIASGVQLWSNGETRKSQPERGLSFQNAGEEAIQVIQAEFPDEFADAIVEGEEAEDISEI